MLPAIDNSVAPVLQPLKTLPQRPFQFSFNRIHLVASDPLFTLQLRVTETPTFRCGAICGFPLLELGIVDVVVCRLGLGWVHGRGVGGGVAAEILHASSMVGLNLHPSVTVRFGSEVFHRRWRLRRKGRVFFANRNLGRPEHVLFGFSPMIFCVFLFS